MSFSISIVWVHECLFEVDRLARLVFGSTISEDEIRPAGREFTAHHATDAFATGHDQYFVVEMHEVQSC
jgi:hypothetical protein